MRGLSKKKSGGPVLPTNNRAASSYNLGNGTGLGGATLGSDPNAYNPNHAALKGKGPLNWYTRKAHDGSFRLAAKNHFVAMVGEFVGTCLFMIFALGGTNVANIPTTSVTGDTSGGGQDGTTVAVANTSSLLYISLSFGFSLAVNAWIFFRVSGGLFNPAVSLGMLLVGALTPLRAALLVVAQILGGIVGAAIIQAILPGTLNVRTTLGGGTSVAQGLFIEMFLTAMLMITILLLAAEKHKATYLAPIGIGLALFIAEMTGVYYTGGSLNPARSFGPNVVLRTFAHYHWIYWLGPALGATLAAGFYKFIKYLEYETVLGPEDADAAKATGSVPVTQSAPQTTVIVPNFAQAGAGGAPALTGPSVAPGGMYDDMPNRPGNTRGNTTVSAPAAKDTGNFAVQGPGIGDLLTHGDPGNAFDMDESARLNASRLDAIEVLLHQLLANQTGQAMTITQGRAGGTQIVALGEPVDSHRDSMATLREGNEAGGLKSKRSVEFASGGRQREGSDEEYAGERSGVAYPNSSVTGHPTSGETSIPGHQYGAPLGRPT